MEFSGAFPGGKCTHLLAFTEKTFAVPQNSVKLEKE
jgi:hypothetical protein